MLPIKSPKNAVYNPPNIWFKGKAANIVSSGVYLKCSTNERGPFNIDLWVNTLPLGLPVVPDVYKIAAISSGTTDFLISSSSSFNTLFNWDITNAKVNKVFIFNIIFKQVNFSTSTFSIISFSLTTKMVDFDFFNI